MGTTIAPDQLLKNIYAVTGFTKEQIEQPNRGKRELSDTRMSIARILHNLFPEFSQAKVGGFVNRDHASVYRYYKIVDETKEVKRVYMDIKNKLDLN